MEEKIKQLISFVQSSLYFRNEAFNEIWFITQTPNTEEEYKLISGPPFSFYGITLQYCFVMEYTKLLEPRPSKESQNVASLFKLNEEVYKLIGEKYESKYLSNRKKIEDLCKSELYIQLRELRDKKFGHSDNHTINNPWEIKGFTGEQIVEMGNQKNILLEIANSCFGAVFDISFGLHKDDRTSNFIRYHAKYKEYYFKNYIKAMEEGYGLR